MSEAKIFKCCFCKDIFQGFGNNAQSIMEGDCCDDCNETRVLPERLRRHQDE